MPCLLLPPFTTLTPLCILLAKPTDLSWFPAKKLLLQLDLTIAVLKYSCCSLPKEASWHRWGNDRNKAVQLIISPC